MSPVAINEKKFDFIVVGGKLDISNDIPLLIAIPGGTAGNVVAGRLAENPKVSVLVIEAGIG